MRAVILKAGRRDAETDDLAQAIADESTVQGVQTKVFFLDDQLFEEISPVEHGAGIMIEIDLPEKPAADDRIRKSDVLYLDGVQDAGNAGTLIRTAVASGVRVIAVSRRGLSPLRQRRCSMAGSPRRTPGEGTTSMPRKAGKKGRLSG